MAFQVGDQVRLTADLEEYEIGAPGKGSTGTVVRVDHTDQLDLCVDWDDYEDGHDGTPWCGEGNTGSHWWVSSEDVVDV